MAQEIRIFMRKNRIIDKEIDAQKDFVQRMKREIFGIDKSVRSSYINAFITEFGTYREICPIEEVLSRSAASDIVYFGDYHPLRESQDWLLRLMMELTSRERKIVLAVEMLYERQQELLDRWMKGMIPESEFLESIDYKSEWGFDWDSYRRIFELAREPFVPIFGIDSEPRDHLKYIRKRDRMMARRIANIRRFFPGYLVLVLIGESHLASSHLPAEIRKVCRSGLVETIIVQNMDEIYWSLLRSGREHVEAVRVDEGKFCIFNTSPMVKYQSYRDIIDRWVEGEGADRFLSALEEMVDYIVSFLAGDRTRVKVVLDGNDFENLDDVFPEVHCRQTYKSFGSLLRSKRIGQLGVVAATESLRRYGVSYVPAINSFLVLDFKSPSAALEAARFVHFALSGRLGADGKTSASAEDRFYRFVIEEALAYTGAKIIDSTLDCLKTDPLLSVIDSRGVVKGPAAGMTLAETRSVVKLLKYHMRRERTKGNLERSTATLKRIHRLNLKKRLLIIRALGHTLGEAIYECHYRGRVSTADILGLFRERADEPGKAKRLYLAWTAETGPFRGDYGALRPNGVKTG
jgi:uncharacterized iron-regulated protein